jgi:hypothetical protein
MAAKGSFLCIKKVSWGEYQNVQEALEKLFIGPMQLENITVKQNYR